MDTGPESASPRFDALIWARLVVFAVVIVAIVLEMRPGLSGAHLAVLLLLVVEIACSIVWTFLRAGGDRTQVVALGVMAGVGGALASFAPAAEVYVGLAALGAGARFGLPLAVGLSSLGPGALALSRVLEGGKTDDVAGLGAAALGGLLLGISRRSYRDRADQEAAVAVARDRAELEHARVGILDERNRLAREIHDVLAHTLGALSVQLEAMSALHEADPANFAAIGEGLRRTKALANEGLDEARRAVQTLREDLAPLEDQLEALCARSGADLELSGTPRPLIAQVTVALYRVAQESLTNVAKHAPGAKVCVRLEFAPGMVALRVANGRGPTGPGPLAASGAGYGLDGIKERVRLLHGDVVAGLDGEGGWAVAARLPT
jgi:signal transduction histidine kinase